MQFRALSLLLALFALGTLVLASPTPSKRQADQSQISSLLSTLNTNVGADISALTALDPSTATLAQVEPYLSDITDQFDTASAGLQALERKRDVAVHAERQTVTPFDEEVATLVATLIKDLAAALDGLLGVPGLGSILPGLSGPINVLLTGLGILLDGVLTLVANLLVDVAGLLDTLGLDLGALDL